MKSSSIGVSSSLVGLGASADQRTNGQYRFVAAILTCCVFNAYLGVFFWLVADFIPPLLGREKFTNASAIFITYISRDEAVWLMIDSFLQINLLIFNSQCSPRRMATFSMRLPLTFHQPLSQKACQVESDFQL